MPLDSFIDKSKHLVETDFHRILSRIAIETPQLLLLDSMNYSLSAGGKRIRPVLVFATHQLFNPDLNKILPVATAIEMIHTYSLIHDDLPSMDNDDFRRGKPTCHKAYGEDIAILAGDTLNTLAFEVLAKELPQHFDAASSLKTISLLSNACGVNGMAGGQVMDLKGAGQNLDYNYLKTTHALKTGALIKACIQIPALLNQANAEELHHLTNLGHHLGILFQIVDDILDVTSDKETLGKSANKDVEQDKLTYVKLFGLEKAKSMASETAKQATIHLEVLAKYDISILQELITYFEKRTH